MKGCFDAHQAACQAGLDAGAAYIVVFEDDVRFEVRGGYTVLDALAAARRALATGETDVVAVGAMALSPFRTELVPCVWTARWNFAHAYVVSAAAAQTIVEWEYVPPSHPRAYGGGSHYDQRLASGLRQSMFIPTIAFQHGYSGDQLTTTNPDSWMYRAAQWARWLVTPRLPQIFLEKLMWYLPVRVPQALTQVRQI